MPTDNLSSDIYGVNDYVNDIKKEFVTEDEDTLMLGIFGYFGQVLSDMMQNSIVMASEFSNESIATKAKFEKNIIAHALGLGITDINAVPAQMEVLLTFIEDEITNWANAKTADGEELPWTFVFDKDNAIYFGDYEFHVDYDIVIKKVEVTTQGSKKRFAYTAQYQQDDFDTGNPVSDITNPYLSPPVKINLEGTNVIFTKCIIRQVEKNVQNTRILSDNDVSAKTITFTFEGQLAAFSLDVTEGTSTYHMIPVYEGLNIDTSGQLYFWYTYLDSNTIRIKFDRNSKIPETNAAVQINLQTTEGSKGNFTFVGTDYPEHVFESERLNYSNIVCQVRPVDGSAIYGTDKKTIEELKQIIPKEALSRGSITNLDDLQNYFNMLDTEYNKLYFYKKRDNCLERLYYAYILMKNELNIIPTNTVKLAVSPEDLMTEEDSGKLILKQGQYIVLDTGSDEARILPVDGTVPDEDDGVYDGSFTYYLPYDFIINRTPLYGMYFLTTMHANKILDFQYINESCLYQYIATKINWERNCLTDHDTYKLGIDVEQNIINTEEDQTSPVYTDDDGKLVCDVYAYLLVYDKDNIPLRWAKAEFKGYDAAANIISFEFQFTTQDYIDNENRIRIDTGLYDIASENESYAHLDANMKTRIFIVSKQEESYGLGIPPLSDYIPNLDGLSLSNTYDVVGGLDFFYDYSGIVNSTITVTQEDDDPTKYIYHVDGVPVVKYDYFDIEDTAREFYNTLITKKTYIDDAIQKLEDAFEMDFKFFNTYGPSKFFTWDNTEEIVDRVNISLFFKLKLRPNYDTNIVEDIRQDIKDYIEDINNINSLHIPNLITEITNNYKESIVFFEFVSINGKDPSYQHIYAMDPPDGIMVPEFININTLADGLPDINIELV